MNRSIRNIFVITALTLTFVPALHCEDTQTHTASTSKLQSAINYIKNIRTPLTPQETLAQHITRADVAGFKSGYDTFMQSDVTPEERAATLQTLAITAQEVKQALQTELDTMGNKIKKSALAKGVAQTILGTYCTLATMFSLAYKSEWNTLIDDGYYIPDPDNEPIMVQLGMILYEHKLTYPIMQVEKLSFKLRLNGYQKLAALSNIIVTPLTGYLAYNSLKSGLQNCKNGWNYKAFVEQQIANIDEINTFIQAQLKN